MTITCGKDYSKIVNLTIKPEWNLTVKEALILANEPSFGFLVEKGIPFLNGTRTTYDALVQSKDYVYWKMK